MIQSSPLGSVAVFCGSSMGFDPVFRQAVERLASGLARRHITVVYGGATVGLMGVLADTALTAGGDVIGVIPQFLADIEIAHQGLTEIHIVDSMHARKTMLAELADAFILMPGGAGSLEEFFEIYTWAQLHLHHKPCGILNVKNYFDPLISFLDMTVTQGFMSAANREMVFVASEVEELLAAFASYEPPVVGKWLQPNLETH